MRITIRSVANGLILGAVSGLLGTTSLSGGAAAQTSQNSYTAFVSAVAALAASANDLVTNERNIARQLYIRQQVTAKVLSAFPIAETTSPTVIKLDDVLDQTTLLCKFRSARQIIVRSISTRDKDASITIDQLATMAEQNYLSGAVGQLSDAAKVPDTTSLIPALKVLFTRPQPTAPGSPPPKLEVLDKTRHEVEANCERDLSEFEAAYYGAPIPVFVAPRPAADAANAAAPAPQIPDLSFLGPIGAAINTAIAIISPVIEGFAAFKAEGDAKERVKTVLTRDQPALTEGGNSLARSVSDGLFAKRLSLAGQFAEQIALVRGDSIDLTSKEMQAACPRPYSAMYTRGIDGKGPLNPAFMRCYSAVWTYFEKGINSALQTAQAYDQLADTGNTSAALIDYAKMTAPAKYKQIVDDSFNANDDFWQQATQLVTFAGAIVTATSPDNQKKLEQAISAALKNP